MPSERDRLQSRRRVLAALATSAGVAVSGCQQLPDGDTSTAGTTHRSVSSTPSVTTPERTTTATTGPEPTTERPLTPACPDCELLETESHDGDGVGHVLPPRTDEQSAAVAILDDGWGERVDETELNADARRFLEATDFEARTVVAVQYTEPGYPQTQRLTRYERDGDELRLALTATDMGPLNAEKNELVLVRPTAADDRPTSATVTVRIGETFELMISTRD